MKRFDKDNKFIKFMTLADIYGVEQDTGYVPEEEKQVGFHTFFNDKKS